ncbi:putative phytanoyl- dioxygenase [Diplodia seriata]|uniref:Putative phytanoyl-dioxygenase n=1 Tax=Diplodia seriata TaxID=420778 RepID=A0A0G2E8B9_9PEZI|nr:putative phytanoyl- dioxygenase [Diplodia seriata]
MSAQPLQAQPSGPNRLLCSEADKTYGDFRDDLSRDGYAIIKGAIPRERADQYADDMYTWLEGFNLGFNRHDPTTIHHRHLPHITEKGMILHYAATHEAFTWRIRSEPGISAPFALVYDTPDLLVSFDALNASFPARTDLPANAPWPHQDQDPERPGFRCLQGLVNLLPNGARDGGLIVCRGAHRLSDDNVAKRDGVDDPHNRFRPVDEPVLDERTFRLTGIPYIQETAEVPSAATVDIPQTQTAQLEVVVGA